MTSRHYYVPAPLTTAAASSGPTSPPPPPPAAAEPPHVPTAVPDPAPWSLPPPPGQTWSAPRPAVPPPAVPPAAGHERWWRRMPKPLLAGAIVAAVAWVVKVSIWTKSSRNGIVTSCSYIDLGAIALGATAIVLSVWGALAAVLDKRPGRRPIALLLGLAAITLALGFVHVFRGLDMVLPQCPKVGSVDTATHSGF